LSTADPVTAIEHQPKLVRARDVVGAFLRERGRQGKQLHLTVN